MKLIQEINQQISSKELHHQGKEFDDIERIWKENGSPKVPEKIYQLLLKILGDKEKVFDAFRYIGIHFRKHKEAAAVLDKRVVQNLESILKNLRPEHIRQLISIVKTGKLQ